MSILIKEADVLYRGKLEPLNIYIDDLGRLTIAQDMDLEADEIIDASSCIILPGLIDLNFNLNNDYKSIKNESKSLASGGYTGCFLSGINDKDLKLVNENIKYDSHVKMYLNCNYSNSNMFNQNNKYTYVYTVNKLNELDDACNLVSENNGVLIVEGTNDELVQGVLNKDYKCQIHITNVQDLNTLKKLKSLGKKNNIYCDLAIGKLLDDEYLNYVKDGTCKMISSNHIVNENNVVEYGFSYLYTNLVKNKKIELSKLVDLMSYNIADIFGVDDFEINNFATANLVIYNKHVNNRIFERDLIGTKKSNMVNKNVSLETLMTIADGKIVYRNKI